MMLREDTWSAGIKSRSLMVSRDVRRKRLKRLNVFLVSIVLILSINNEIFQNTENNITSRETKITKLHSVLSNPVLKTKENQPNFLCAPSVLYLQKKYLT